MLFRSIITVTIILTIGGCGGGALVSQNSYDAQEGIEFCGLDFKFSSKPKVIQKNDLDAILDSFGKFTKNNLSGLYSDNHQLLEVALCLCADTAEPLGMKTMINPAAGATNINKETIHGIGLSESWIKNDSSQRLKTYFRVIDLSLRSSCQLLQYVVTPDINEKYPTFFSNIDDTKSKTNNKTKTSTKDRLIQLEELKKSGLINQSDYDAKKKVILESL